MRQKYEESGKDQQQTKQTTSISPLPLVFYSIFILLFVFSSSPLCASLFHPPPLPMAFAFRVVVSSCSPSLVTSIFSMNRNRLCRIFTSIFALLFFSFSFSFSPPHSNPSSPPHPVHTNKQKANKQTKTPPIPILYLCPSPHLPSPSTPPTSCHPLPSSSSSVTVGIILSSEPFLPLTPSPPHPTHPVTHTPHEHGRFF